MQDEQISAEQEMTPSVEHISTKTALSNYGGVSNLLGGLIDMHCQVDRAGKKVAPPTWEELEVLNSKLNEAIALLGQITPFMENDILMAKVIKQNNYERLMKRVNGVVEDVVQIKNTREGIRAKINDRTGVIKEDEIVEYAELTDAYTALTLTVVEVVHPVFQEVMEIFAEAEKEIHAIETIMKEQASPVTDVIEKE